MKQEPRQRGYRGLLDGSETAPNDVDVLDPAKDMEKIRLQKMNKMGYSELISLLSGKSARVAFMLVKKVHTTGLPNGSLNQAWTNLEEQYKQDSIDTVEQVIKEYNECVLEKNEDPEEWVAQKDELRMRLQIDYGKKDYEDEDFRVAIVYQLPEKYHSEKIMLRDKYKSMSLSDMVKLL